MKANDSIFERRIEILFMLIRYRKLTMSEILGIRFISINDNVDNHVTPFDISVAQM